MQVETIQSRIYEVRGQKIMLDRDLAELFQTETRILKQAVKRNMARFPTDFLFVLTAKEIEHLVSQNVIPSKSYFGGAKPFAFTEHGVTMLANVLKSQKAIDISIAIVRAFIALRQYMLNYKDLGEQLKELQQITGEHNKQFADVYKVLNLLLENKQAQADWKNRKQIGFKSGKENEPK